MKSPKGTRAKKPAKAGEDIDSGNYIINFDAYIPTVLARLVAKMRANSHSFFSERFGVTIAGWRILSYLWEFGPSSGYDIWTKSRLDKALVSRETSALARKGLVRITAVDGSSRNKTSIAISPAGLALIKGGMPEIVERHQNLIAGLDEESLATFFRVIAHIEARIPHMSDAFVGSPHKSPVKSFPATTT